MGIQSRVGLRERRPRAVRRVVAADGYIGQLQRATHFPQAPEYDVFQNVNAIARGWSNYYHYAHNNNVTGGKLSQVIYWLTVHYLGKRHRHSLANLPFGKIATSL
jgi:hypothetical protein